MDASRKTTKSGNPSESPDDFMIQETVSWALIGEQAEAFRYTVKVEK